MENPPRDRRPSRPWQEDFVGTPSRTTSRPRVGSSAGVGGPRPSGAPGRRPGSQRTRQTPPEPIRRKRLAAKIALGLVSVLVVSLTGYAWAAMQGLLNGITSTDVIDASAGSDGARDILLVGLDSRTDAQGNPLPKEVLDQLRAGQSDGELNTDTLIFVHIPNDGSKAVAISLPRDSYVNIPGGYGKHKINSAYSRGMLAARNDLQKQGITDPKELDQKANQAGAKTLIATVSELTGSTIDNYAAINLLGFSDITRAIGGVDVCLNDAVNDSYSGAKFTKGQHTISGVEALEFVRQRHGLPRGDLDRVVRQQVFMAGMASKMLSAGTLGDPGKLGNLIDAIKKSVVLNQGWDILSFAQQLKGLTGGQLEFRTIPVVNVDYKTPEDGSAIQVDPKQIHDFVRGVDGKPDQQPAPTPPGNRGVTVDVRNASGKTGLAATVAQELTGKGFTAGDTANSSARKTTVVRVPTGQEAAGRTVADLLGSKATVETDKTIDVGHVMVFLGADYSGQAASTSATPGSLAPSQARPDPAADKAITANGVTCVN